MAVSTMNDVADAAVAGEASPTLGRPKFCTSAWLAWWVGVALWAAHALATA